MVEYTRLISRDWLQRLTTDWQRPDTIKLVGVVAVIIVIGYFVIRRK